MLTAMSLKSHAKFTFYDALCISANAVAERPRDASCLSSQLQHYNNSTAVFYYYILASNLPLHTIKFCSVVFGIAFRLLS